MGLKFNLFQSKVCYICSSCSFLIDFFALCFFLMYFMKRNTFTLFQKMHTSPYLVSENQTNN